MAGSAESVEQVWLLGRVVTVCWLGGRLCSAGRAEGSLGGSTLASVREKRRPKTEHQVVH